MYFYFGLSVFHLSTRFDFDRSFLRAKLLFKRRLTVSLLNVRM